MNNEVTTWLHIYSTAANHQQNRVALRFKTRNGAKIDGLQIPPGDSAGGGVCDLRRYEYMAIQKARRNRLSESALQNPDH